MKKLFVLCSSLLLSIIISQAQVPVNIKFNSSSSIYPNANSNMSIKKDVEFQVNSVYYDFKYSYNNYYRSTYMISATQSGKDVLVPAFAIPKGYTMQAAEDNLQNYWFAKNFATLGNLSEIKDLYRKRAEIEKEANEYVSMLSRYNLIFDDPYLESYLYGIISKIRPNVRADGFPYDIKIVIVSDPSLNASIFPNGTLLINTGLLASVHTEDELVAVLAHEMAHFVRNHALINIREMEKAEARAAFWAGLGTAIAAAAEVYAGASGYYQADGSFTTAAAMAFYSIAASALETMGMQFSRGQEEAADKIAVDVLNYLNYDKNAVATVFQRMADIYNEEGNWAAYYMTGDHPSLKERISYSGNPDKKRNAEFEKKVSFAVSSAAVTKFNQGRFSQSLKLVEQNIENNVGTDDDFLIKALCLINLFDDNEHNKEALKMIQTAKSINSNNSNILRTEIIANLRYNNLEEAKSSITAYKNRIEEELSQLLDQSSGKYRFLSAELDWARKMEVKTVGL